MTREDLIYHNTDWHHITGGRSFITPEDVMEHHHRQQVQAQQQYEAEQDAAEAAFLEALKASEAQIKETLLRLTGATWVQVDYDEYDIEMCPENSWVSLVWDEPAIEAAIAAIFPMPVFVRCNEQDPDWDGQDWTGNTYEIFIDNKPF